MYKEVKAKRDSKEIELRNESLKKRGLEKGIPYYITTKELDKDIQKNELFLDGWENGYIDCFMENSLFYKNLNSNEEFSNEFHELCEKHNIKFKRNEYK